MDIPYRVCVAASIVLLASSCATRTTILPALDASKTTKAKALVVQADHVRGFNSPIKIVRGSGEGAKEGMRYYVSGALDSDPLSLRSPTSGGKSGATGQKLAPSRPPRRK